jgi:hypothetical protein
VYFLSERTLRKRRMEDYQPALMEIQDLGCHATREHAQPCSAANASLIVMTSA